MHDLRDELAELVADVSATLDALRLQGTIVLPVDAAWPSPVKPDALPSRAEAPARPPPIPPGMSARPQSAPPPPRMAAPPPPPASPAPAAPAAGGLLGRWAEQLVGPEERLQTVVSSLGEACSDCGLPTLRGVGALRSGLALCVDPCSAAETGMLANMLLKVVGVEPEDVWTTSPRTCPACIDALRRQVEAIKPRVFLALGAGAAAAAGLPRGDWGQFAQSPAIATWHPAEIAADATKKRPAFDVLVAVAKRR